MNSKEPIENNEQGSTEARKQAIDRMTNPPYETHQEFTADSPSNWALWSLSLVLKEISENSETPSNDKQPPV